MKTLFNSNKHLNKALICCVLWSVLLLLSGVVWETNDDEAIAFLLSRKENDYSPFQWRVLSIFVHYLYIKYPICNWWMVINVLLIWISGLVVTCIVFERYDNKQRYIVTTFMLVLLWLVAVYRVNFTRTAAVISMAGCLMIADGIFDKTKTSAGWVKYIIGVLLMLLGASVRNRCAMIAIGFLAIIGFDRLIEDGFCYSIRWIKKHIIQMIMLINVLFIFLGSFFIDRCCLSPEQEAYLEYNIIRSSIQDYKQNYPSYSDAEEKYESIGVDETSLKEFFRWFSEDTEVFDVHTLKQISGVAETKFDVSVLVDLLRDEFFVLIFSVLFIIFVVIYDHKNLMRVGLTIIGLAFCAILLTNEGRFPSRVFESIIWCLVCSVLFLSGCKDRDNSDRKIGRMTFWVMQCLLIFAACIGVIKISECAKIDGNSREKVYELKTYAEKRRSLDLINEDKEKIYIFDIYKQPIELEYAFSCWEPKPVSYCENHFVLGGWEVRHPYYVSLLSMYRISNPVVALYENTNTYSMYSKRVLTHLQIHYDKRITVSETSMLGDYPLVQYSAPIDSALLMYNKNVKVDIIELSYCKKEEDTWFICLNAEEIDIQTGVFYCNIILNGVPYTYRLGNENGVVSAYLYGLNQEQCFSEDNMQIVQLTTEGEYVVYDVEFP